MPHRAQITHPLRSWFILSLLAYLVLTTAVILWWIFGHGPAESFFDVAGNLGGFLEGTAGVAVALSGAFVAIILAVTAQRTVDVEARRNSMQLSVSQTEATIAPLLAVGYALAETIEEMRFTYDSEIHPNIPLTQAETLAIARGETGAGWSAYRQINWARLADECTDSISRTVHALEQVSMHPLAAMLWRKSVEHNADRISKLGVKYTDPGSIAIELRRRAYLAKDRILKGEITEQSAAAALLFTHQTKTQSKSWASRAEFPGDELIGVICCSYVFFADWDHQHHLQDPIECRNNFIGLLLAIYYALPKNKLIAQTLAEYFEQTIDSTQGEQLARMVNRCLDTGRAVPGILEKDVQDLLSAGITHTMLFGASEELREKPSD